MASITKAIQCLQRSVFGPYTHEHPGHELPQITAACSELVEVRKEQQNMRLELSRVRQAEQYYRGAYQELTKRLRLLDPNELLAFMEEPCTCGEGEWGELRCRYCTGAVQLRRILNGLKKAGE